MKKITQKVYQYTTIFEPDEKSGGFTVTIPALPGCISEGDNFEKALNNIKEAAILYLEVIRERKNVIPQERGVIIAPLEVEVQV
ncbi:type II toxin-antitoxin system HicB family antitoxin [Candidatus Azambacteria bacterium]|nr:type II toxin-antitoxin system HicB family antitoxin [Candidatus Azambacteria bacterium]